MIGFVSFRVLYKIFYVHIKLCCLTLLYMTPYSYIKVLNKAVQDKITWKLAYLQLLHAIKKSNSCRIFLLLGCNL
jgi:hypothetical protein